MTPRHLISERSGGLRGNGARTLVEPVGVANGGIGWTPAVATLVKTLPRAGRRGANVDVVFSGTWARYELIPIGETRLTDAEAAQLVRAQFARQYPETMQGNWPLRHELHNRSLLGAGMDPGLLTALQDAVRAAGMRLAHAQPLFAWTYQRHQKALAGVNGWMLLDEPGLLTAARIERGQLASVCTQRCEAQREEMAARLLDRQNALLPQQTFDVCTFSVGRRAFELPAPWRTVMHHNILDVEGAGPLLIAAAGAASSSH